MTLIGWLQIAALLLLVLAALVPLGRYMARLFTGQRTFLHPVLGPVERGLYRAAGIDPAREQGWFAYTLTMLVFSALGFASLYAILRLQAVLPFNPLGLPAVPLEMIDVARTIEQVWMLCVEPERTVHVALAGHQSR